ncbi:MAG: dihydroorotase [Candidatus Melainabacteria bacterium]|nr:MAG: dihydroorotase [Candidatus Melainabacteria bacterium]
MTSNLRIRKADDMHIHLRQGELLAKVLPHTASQCARALVMPNTTPPIVTADDLNNYRNSIQKLLKTEDAFVPLMTFRVMPTTTPAMVKDHKRAGATAGKLYPEGVTTNSEGGVKDLQTLYPVYKAMEEEGLVLCLHGEVPGVFSLDRETAFLETLRTLAKDFPKLKIVLEHATTADAIDTVLKLSANVAATLTAHHLRITLDDVIGDKLNPHVFCKPIAKRPADRDALLKAATSGNPKFFLGSDSAPHPVESKECACGAAGVYTAPVLLPVLAETFESAGHLDKLESFTSRFGAEFYRLPLNEQYIELHRESWTVENQYGGVVPFMAGHRFAWKLSSASSSSKANKTKQTAKSSA